jgi:hypothetical protein
VTGRLGGSSEFRGCLNHGNLDETLIQCLTHCNDPTSLDGPNLKCQNLASQKSTSDDPDPQSDRSISREAAAVPACEG